MYLEHLRIPVGDGTLHVERLGRGSRAVMLVHGFGTSAALWRRAAVHLADAGYLVLCPELLGHGESDRPLDASYDLGSQGDALERALAALRIPQAVVVGQDVGGLVALALAARHPDRVSQLVLVNPPDVSDLPPAPVRAMQRAATRVALGPGGGHLAAAALLAPLLADATTAEPRLSRAATARYLAPWVGDGGVEQLLLLARTLETDSVPLEALAAVETPTLIVRADGDRSVPPTVSVALARAMPHANVVTLRGVGRLLAEEAPELLARTITAVLGDSTHDRPASAAAEPERQPIVHPTPGIGAAEALNVGAGQRVIAMVTLVSRCPAR